MLKFSQSLYILTIQTPVGCITLVGFHAEDGKVMENWRRHFSDLHLRVCFNEKFGKNMVFFEISPCYDDPSLYWDMVILNQRILALRKLCGTFAIWDAGSGRLMQVIHLTNFPIPAHLKPSLCSDSDGKMSIVVEGSDSLEFTAYESSGDCWTKNEAMSFSFQSLKSSIGYARYKEIGVGSIHGKWVCLFFELAEGGGHQLKVALMSKNANDKIVCLEVLKLDDFESDHAVEDYIIAPTHIGVVCRFYASVNRYKAVKYTRFYDFSI